MVDIEDLDKFPGFLSKQIVRKLVELKLDDITIVKKVNLKDNITKTNEKSGYTTVKTCLL